MHILLTSFALCFQIGPKDLTEKNLGVNYRALSDLFLLEKQRKDTFCYNVAVQMIEIYNEQVRDLLVTDGSNKRYPLQLLFFGYLQVYGLDVQLHFILIH